MNKSTTTLIATSAALLIVGFGIGFFTKGAGDRQNTDQLTTVPVKQMPLQAQSETSTNKYNDWLSENQRVAPDLWRLTVNPFGPSITEPGPKASQSPFKDLPPQGQQVQTSVGDNQVLVAINVPGMTEKDIDVQVGSEMLVVKGQQSEEQQDKDKDFRSFNRAFEETMRLPCKVDGKKAKATVQDGVLTIAIPRADKNLAGRADKAWH